MALNKQVMRRVEALQPYDQNARTHSEAQVDQLAASISEFGWTNPVLVDENDSVIAGHGRLLAAKKLGMREVPAIILSGLSQKQKRALRLADNKLALNAGWDEDLLRLELGELRADGFDVELTGFGELEIDSLFAQETSPDEEWQGMPEFNQNDKGAYQTIAVHFRDQEEVQAFAALVGQPLTNKTRFIWFGGIEIERYMDKRYTVDEPPIPDFHSVEG